MPVKGARKIIALKRRKVREAERKYLIEGIRLCEEALGVGAPVEQRIFCLHLPRTQQGHREIPIQVHIHMQLQLIWPLCRRSRRGRGRRER